MGTIALATAKDRLLDRLERNSEFYPDSQLTGAFNDAVKTLNLFTGFYTAKAQILSQDDCGIYRVPRSLIVVTRVRYDGRDLDPLGYTDLRSANPRWMKETVNSEGFGPSTWTALGLHVNKKIILHPAPSVGGRIIEMSGVGEPPPLTSDTDTLTASTEFTDIIFDLAVHQLMMKCGGRVAFDGMMLYQTFLSRMKSLKRFRSKVNPRFWIEVDQKTENA